MKLLIIITISLLLAVIGASILQGDTGYVLVRFRDYRIELNLVLFVLLGLLLIFLVYLLVRFLSRTFSAPKDLKKWREHRNLVNSQKNLTKGFIALGEGEYKKAQKILTKIANNSDEPLVPLLAAANAAQQQGDSYSSEYLLNQATDVAPGARNALSLAQAEQYLNTDNLLAAEEILDSIKPKFANNPIYLRLQSQLLLKGEKWDKLIALLPKIKRKSNLPEADINELEYKSYRHQLLNAKDHNELNDRWRQIPKSLRNEKSVSVDFIHKLVETEQHGAAGKYIVSLLRNKWDDDLVNLYSQLDISDVTPQIKNLEKWVKDKNDNHLLHLGLGRLYSKKELWVMAKESLEKSLALENTPETRGLLLEAKEHIAAHEN